jgi:hypothetical protein
MEAFGVAEANTDVVRKIQKLLSLANSSNEAEAALAMARAQELLAKHNLDYAIVKDQVVPGGVAEAAPEKREKVTIKRSAQYQWQIDLWKSLAEANFCFHWIIEVKGGGRKKWGYVKRHAFLGKESNVAVVQAMGEYLCDTLERLLPYPNNERLSRSANSWRRGCVDRIVHRINKQAEKLKNDSDKASKSAGTAIALRNVFESEFQANYDARWGAGAWGRKLIEDSQWEAERPERERKAREEREKAEREWLEYLQNETPEQKKEREREEQKQRMKEERARERRHRSWDRQRWNEALKTDDSAYDAGSSAGDRINLGAQLGEGRTRKDRSLT